MHCEAVGVEPRRFPNRIGVACSDCTVPCRGPLLLVLALLHKSIAVTMTATVLLPLLLLVLPLLLHLRAMAIPPRCCHRCCHHVAGALSTIAL